MLAAPPAGGGSEALGERTCATSVSFAAISSDLRRIRRQRTIPAEVMTATAR